MLKQAALIVLGVGIPLLTNLPVTLNFSGDVASAQSMVRKLPTKAAISSRYLPKQIAQSVRQDAIQYWGFPRASRVVQIEPTTYQQKGDVLWISATAIAWKVTLESADQRLIYLTNDTGSVKVLASRTNLKLPANLPDSVIKAVQRSTTAYWYPLYKTTVTPLHPAQVLIKQAKPVTWNDGCLEVPNAGEGCTRGKVKGWQIVAEGLRTPSPTAEVSSLTFRVDETGRKIRADIPPDLAKLAFKSAEEWGLAPRSGRIIGAEAMQWGEGCEGVKGLPIACDPVPISGWLVKIEQQGRRWQIRIGQNSNGKLIAQENLAVDASFDSGLADKVRLLASQHLELSPEQVLFLKAEPGVFGGCLGLGSPVEDCLVDPGQGYRVTVEGKPGQQQVYRVSSNSGIRAESNQGLPPRTDAVPTRIARKVFQDARSRLNSDLANLRIAIAEPGTECFRTPTDNPNLPCPVTVPGGWKITVTNFQKQLVYQVSSAGEIKSVSAL